jgi:hypothetical protein
MFETLALLLMVIWVLGIGTGYTLGGLIHILLVLAIVSVLFRIIQDRKLLK